ncbi:5'-AMP-activated protein kinase beta subunit, interation domain-containing protein [Podospora australis]|uniref:5'-AMP-activated protein kinase beta subunit, interation domain-containing protein n=1 Tax=Podospora australis TaxID=1536484 RepID=A0AAN6X142_9PEZI|nr:5'-AMP-activated protein kinase beta subunit, interation domain-containing protein [Podospora australis]
MGNSPSTSKPGSQSSSYQSNAQNESPRPVRRDNKHPIPVHDRRVAAPPEPSLTQAQGTAVQPPASSSSHNRPNPLQHRPIPTTSGNSTPSSSADATVVNSTGTLPRPVEGKQGIPSPSPEPAKPVDVPYPHHSPSSPRSPRSPTSEDTYEAFAMPQSSLQDVSYLTRPPRLPLPIEEEVHTPGSPIISPADIGQPLEDVEGLLDDTGLARPLSTLSNNGPDEEEEEEDDAEGLLVDKSGPRVPTRLEWRHGGEKIYVTGTMFQWSRKTRLRPVEGRVGVYAATVNFLPGTHHVRFLVDGVMAASPDYPQTVDVGNNLVNYIEVSADTLLKNSSKQNPIASASSTKDEKKTEKEDPLQGEEHSKAPKYREVPLASLFEHKIPRYLLDFDQPEDTPPYHNACSAIEKLPNPPGLPGFLGKPILNAASLIKDDNSVLSMPNHTVLNHLATSSIKNNILAVSATTRYKNKYVTTIMYKPTTAEGI